MHRHERVLVDLLAPEIGRVAVIGVPAVGDVHGPAEIAEEGALPKHLVVGQSRQERVALHLGRPGRAEDVEERRGEVDRLCEGPAPGPVGHRHLRMVDEEGDVGDLLVEGHPVLGPEIVLAEKEAVVGGDDEGCVLPETQAVEDVQKLAQQLVAQGHQGVVVGAQLVALGRQLVDPAIARPVADGAVPAGLERPLEALRRREGLVRVEGLELQEPAVGGTVPLQKVERRVEAADRRKILFLFDELAIDEVVAEIAARLGAELARVVHLAEPLPRRLDHGLPRVLLLTADELVGVEAAVVGGAAIVPVMAMVGDKMAVDAGRPQQLREGIVKRLERPPTPVKKVEPAGLHVAPSRHAGQAACIVPLEDRRPPCQPVEIGRRDPAAVIGSEHMPVERVEENKNALHPSSPNHRARGRRLSRPAYHREGLRGSGALDGSGLDSGRQPRRFLHSQGCWARPVDPATLVRPQAGRKRHPDARAFGQRGDSGACRAQASGGSLPVL